MNQFKTSLLASNIFDPLVGDEQNVIELYQKIADLNFYDSLETRLIFDKNIRRSFATLAERNNWNVTYWLTSNLNQKQLRLCSSDQVMRRKAVEYVKQLILMGYEGGASYIGICSGKSLGNRREELIAFLDSILELIEFIKPLKSLQLLLEPLDMFADKKHVVGDLQTTAYVMEYISKYSSIDLVSLCIDTAHIALNNDDIFEYIQNLGKYSNRIHLSNAILSKTHKDFGDKHIEFDRDGFLTFDEAKKIIKFSLTEKMYAKEVFFTVEVRCKDRIKCWDMERKYREKILSVFK